MLKSIYQTYNQNIEPITKDECLVDYMRFFSKKVESKILRKNGKDTYSDHIEPMVESGQELFNLNNNYFEIFISMIYGHDLIEDSKNKYIITNPYETFENIPLYLDGLRNSSISINSLLKAKGVQGRHLSFGLFLLTKYEHSLKDYMQNLFTAYKRRDDILSIHLGTALVKGIDMNDNNDPEESCDNIYVLEKKFRIGLERLFDLPILENFILNPEFEHLEIYNYNNVRDFIAKTKDGIYTFFEKHPVEYIVDRLNRENVKIKTKRYGSLDFYMRQLIRYDLMPKGKIVLP